jgi:hypothetical protein
MEQAVGEAWTLIQTGAAASDVSRPDAPRRPASDRTAARASGQNGGVMNDGSDQSS